MDQVGNGVNDNPETLRQWIGRTETSVDVITPRLAEGLRATVGSMPSPDNHAPPAIHWCLSPAIVPPERLGPDGHPARGGFLPPVALLSRLWAGGEIRFMTPLMIGDTVARSSRIADIAWKSGRSGPLCFVAVDHEYRTERGLALTERQDIVYRGASGPYAPPPFVAELPADLRQAAGVDEVTLFRYSALTFNSHRIHFDAAYATNAEGYPGLVVHGPLQATLLLDFATREGARVPARFSYRGVRPIFCGEPITLNLRRDADMLSLWTSGSEPAPAMVANAYWLLQA